MDSDLSDIPDPGPRRPVLWPGLWGPAVILVCGVILSLLTARLASDMAHQLAHQHYQALHQSLVSQVVVHLARQSQADDQLQELRDTLATGLHDGISLRIDTLERHTKKPLIQLGSARHPAGNDALRTELQTNGRHWMVTTWPDSRLLASPARRMGWLVGASGGMITAVATLLALALCRQAARKDDNGHRLAGLNRIADQRITNLQVEKNVLRQALNDSESRSRDLVALSGAIVSELDEQGQIGFVSAQVADVLGLAPSDLINRPFSELLAEPDRERFYQCLAAARQETTLARVDVNLLHRSAERTVPAVVRVMVLKDPIHGVTGFRLSALNIANGYNG
ncbi:MULTISPECIES: PAS domain-containing protein [unclassified Marinobacter]|uniref:PAS domain-containing protein n=1 Tax=unclassified Marinobacter TaxID=83889 RepID=UPI001267A92C|nr:MULTISPECIES: PAS domain-containing protein [unclassified Marinobacter]QFS88872.1 PAS fold protein [Marinobacter sp. THAF197a]QFT52657.1 PAS fold protein [Marinobacter sp. THAF39]